MRANDEIIWKDDVAKTAMAAIMSSLDLTKPIDLVLVAKNSYVVADIMFLEREKDEHNTIKLAAQMLPAK